MSLSICAPSAPVGSWMRLEALRVAGRRPTRTAASRPVRCCSGGDEHQAVGTALGRYVSTRMTQSASCGSATACHPFSSSTGPGAAGQSTSMGREDRSGWREVPACPRPTDRALATATGSISTGLAPPQEILVFAGGASSSSAARWHLLDTDQVHRRHQASGPLGRRPRGACLRLLNSATAVGAAVHRTPRLTSLPSSWAGVRSPPMRRPGPRGLSDARPDPPSRRCTTWSGAAGSASSEVPPWRRWPAWTGPW